MSEPRPYDLDDPDEIGRLHRECLGYLRTSRKNGLKMPDALIEGFQHLIEDKSTEHRRLAWIMALMNLTAARRKGLDGGDRRGRDYAIEALGRLLNGERNG